MKQKQPVPSFRNTKSKFYSKKPSHFEDDSFAKVEENTGNFWKEKGNKEFKKGNLLEAIEFYSEAINKNPSESTYFSNRALCYKNLSNFTEALKDAEEACEIDPESIKSNYLCGCILAELGKQNNSKLVKAENRFKKALRQCDTQKNNRFEEDISIRYYRLKKLIWYKQIQAEIEGIQEEREVINSADTKTVGLQKKEKILKRLGDRLSELKRQREIPDYLCCKITLELMEDPVMTEEGLTYEKSALSDHFSSNGFTEPISRKKLSNEPNRNQALKSAVLDFLDKNPWAYEHNPGEDFMQIKF